MDYKSEYELRKEAMERFRDVHKDPQYVSDMVGWWNNNIRDVIKKMSQLSFEKNTYHNELTYAQDMLKRFSAHAPECNRFNISGTCDCGLNDALDHLKEVLKSDA